MTIEMYDTVTENHHPRIVPAPVLFDATLVSQAADEAVAELLRAQMLWPRPFSCAHEGVSVIREEFEELWDEVKINQSRRNLDKMRKEAVQLAAMALRFVVEVCDQGRGRV